MADMTCPKCGEPWDTYHVRNEAFEGDEYDGPDGMPHALQALWHSWVELEPFSGTDEERAARDALGLAYYKTGLSKGCTACWYEPDRVLSGEAQTDALRRALFDSAWDGDPAEFFA